jgi:succinate-semialdehyde dehydrogenase/glutarate-semialdehyde dehydrogenase
MPYQLYINGEWRDGAAGKTVDVENPATGEIVATSAYGEVSDAIAAMDAAACAFTTWKVQTAYVRGGHLDKAATLIRQRAKEISRVLTEENGKTFAESIAETIGCAMWFEWFAEEGKRVYGRMIPSHYGHKRHWVLHQPVGVVVAVNPWNFPINLMCRKLGGALAAGCTIVTRPATQTPLSTMLLFEAKCCRQIPQCRTKLHRPHPLLCPPRYFRRLFRKGNSTCRSHEGGQRLE